MKLAMTIMVRDEADIIAAMLDHHLEQGVDVIIATDNGSIDGTADILEGYAARGLVQLHHDPVQRKQQSSVVTRMARQAYTDFGADWVINADADEFFVPVNRSRTLHETFELIPTALRSFLVPVVNLTGPPAVDGSGLQRLVYRDRRTPSELHHAGVRAHPTPDAVHVGAADVDVIQGNHFVSIASAGSPDPDLGIEVLHLPWRSWTQYRNKVENAGRAYEQNPDLTPSPNHHGMRDYARLQAGSLLPYYFMRHPGPADLAKGLESGSFVEERYLAEHITGQVPDEPFASATEDTLHAFASALQHDRVHLAADLASEKDDALRELQGELDELRSENISLREANEAYGRRLVVRLADRVARLVRRN